ncbi:MAG TPA: NADP-dependent phosphogluconate dehydrogenase [Candidatus Bathyarchaeia archaeon]|nr:NADP-dependent phosphogluconate dehydrogenase [Candidatus Bathyarchaeia archaeon]
MKTVGLIGLGRMGLAIADRLLARSYTVIGYDISEQARHDAIAQGVEIAPSLEQIYTYADLVWIMVPAGEIVDKTVDELLFYNSEKKIIIVDGGNSFYKDSQHRAEKVAKTGNIFLDCGTSGGIHGREKGFCLMVGGTHEGYIQAEAVFSVIAAPGGCAYVGPSGAGHYVKMIHNGIEYGILQAYGEGFQLLKEGSFKNLDLEVISRIWNTSAVIRSWILELAHTIFVYDNTMMKQVQGIIDEHGTGQWTIQEAEKDNIPVPVIKSALDARAWSRKTRGNYATKIVALLRNKFGGHPVHQKKEN